MRKIYGIFIFVMIICIGCQWQLKPNDADDAVVSIQRYDRIESLYLTTGDYSALQQMNTYFPMQTRTLIEDVLKLGRVDDNDINTKFLYFFQDSTLQRMLNDVHRQYVNMDDVDEEMSKAFEHLKKQIPDLEIPEIYAQISSFDQSIVVDSNRVGISLDKYLGVDYPFYQTHYTDEQRKNMVRSMIVPDCLGFYLLSLFPIEHQASQQHRDLHMSKIQWVVNKVMKKQVFKHSLVASVDRYMKDNPSVTVTQLLHPENHANLLH